MPLDVLTINRLHLNVHVPHRRPEWRALGLRWEHLARERLAPACEQACATLLNGDPGVYVVDRLAVEMTVGGRTLTDRDLTVQLSHAIVSQVQDALARPPAGTHILRFASEADFLAAFLSDLLHGQAWERWYYRCFAPARALPSGQAAMQLLTEDSSRGHEALVLLAQRGGLERLLVELNEGQAQTIVEHCLLPPGMPDIIIAGAHTGWVQALTRLLQESGHALVSWQGHKATLWLYLALLRQRSDLGPDSTLARFVADLLLLRQAGAALPQPSLLLTYVNAGDTRSALRLLSAHAPARALTFLAALLREVASPEAARLLREMMQSRKAGVAQSSEDVGNRSTQLSTATTLFGGLFLLVHALMRLGLDEWLAQCPYPDPEHLPCRKSNLLLFVLGLQALGARWAQQGTGDPGLAWFAGLDDGPDREALNAYARQVTLPMHTAFLHGLSEHLHARGHSAAPIPKALAQELDVGRLRAFRLCQGEDAVLDNRVFDAVLSIVTGSVLREFTRSLRGFESSSPDYVRRNFLLAPARLERDATRLHVQFERCPLEVVLRLAGFDRGQPGVPWLGERRLAFSFGG